MTSSPDRPRPARAPRGTGPARSDTYVYLIAAVSGRPPAALLTRLPRLPDGAKARAVPLDDRIALVVSDVAAATYRPEVLEPRLADGDWVGRSGAVHHAAIAALARRHAALPFRIFTIFSSDARMRSTLRRSRARIGTLLAGLAGRDEWVLRIGPPDAGRRRDGDEQPAGPAQVSGTGFLQRKAAATRERSARAARVKAEAAAVYTALAALADRAVARDAPPGVNVLLDAAFLIDRGKLARFKKALTRAAQPLLEEGCKVSFTGPWPAYSFASLD